MFFRISVLFSLWPGGGGLLELSWTKTYPIKKNGKGQLNKIMKHALFNTILDRNFAKKRVKNNIEWSSKYGGQDYLMLYAYQ